MTTYNVDKVAGVLADLGRRGAELAPAWDGAGCASLAAGPDGQPIGRVLHGRGLELGSDLKSYGITRPIPHVFERSLVQRAADHARKRPDLFLKPYYHRGMRKVVRPDYEQAAIRAAAVALALGLSRHVPPHSFPTLLGALTTYDGIIAARAGGKADDNSFTKASLTTAANLWFSLWRATGIPPAGSFEATTAPTESACDRSTTGAMGFLRNPGGTDKKYLLSFGYTSASTINMGILIDVLVKGGAFRLTVSTAETVAAPTTVPRNYGNSGTGAGNQICFVVTTATSATGHTLTVSYKDTAAAAHTTNYVHPATAIIADGIYPTSFGAQIPLAAGDIGVQSVSATTSNTALAAGIINLLLYYPLCFVPGVASSSYIERPMVALDGLVELVNATQVIGALSLLVNTNAATSGVLTGFMKTAEG